MITRRLALLAPLLTPLFAARPADAAWAPYPGARDDPALTTRANAIAQREGLAALAGVNGLTGPRAIATTNDPFDRVLAFYRPRGREFRLPSLRSEPGMTGYERDLPGELRVGPNGLETAPSGIRVKQALFVFDNAMSLRDSRDYIAIVRPFVFDISRDGLRLVYRDIRDVTAILRMG